MKHRFPSFFTVFPIFHGPCGELVSVVAVSLQAWVLHGAQKLPLLLGRLHRGCVPRLKLLAQWMTPLLTPTVGARARAIARLWAFRMEFPMFLK